MKSIYRIIFALFLVLTSAVHAAPVLNLEEQIASQQGKFGALYAHCGLPDQKAVIGGSLATWRVETLRGYKGTVEERTHLEQAFDRAADSIGHDTLSCSGWVKQAADTWHDIASLANSLDSNTSPLRSN